MSLPPEPFLQDIFGRTSEGVHSEGLVDANDSSDFAERLDSLEEEWNRREKEYISSGECSFFFLGLSVTRLMKYYLTCYDLFEKLLVWVVHHLHTTSMLVSVLIA